MAWYDVAQKVSSVASKIPGARAVGAGLARGASTNARIVGASGLANEFNQAANNIASPYRSVAGYSNPAYTGNIASWGSGAGGGINSQSPIDYYGNYNGYGGGGAGGGGSAVNIGALQNDIRSKIGSIMSAYDLYNNNLNSSIQDKSNQLNSNYANQFDALGNQFKSTVNGNVGAYGARGLGDSSYLGNAQDEATSTFNTNNTAIQNDKNGAMAALGQAASQQQAGINAGRANYQDILGNLGNYDSGTLQSLQSSIGSDVGDIQGQAAGLGSNAQFISALNGIAPQQNQGASQLQSQLQKIVGSGLPQFAKNQLTSGLINQSGVDQNGKAYWSDYLKQIQGA